MLHTSTQRRSFSSRISLYWNFPLLGTDIGRCGSIIVTPGFIRSKDSRPFGHLLFTMSSITIATLPRMSRDALSALLLSTSTPSKLAIVDVRDSGP